VHAPLPLPPPPVLSAPACLCAAPGSEDGTAKVWDLRSRQLLRTLPSFNKAPVAAALVAQWPEHLVAGAAAGSRAGPKRPLPLAPLAKFPGAARHPVAPPARLGNRAAGRRVLPLLCCALAAGASCADTRPIAAAQACPAT
jgi:hypothetical protein